VVEEKGEIPSSLSSTKRTATSTPLFSAGMAASIQPPTRRLFGLVVGAQWLLATKWFIPGGCSSSLEGSQRASSSCSSVATPGGRRRAVAVTPRARLLRKIVLQCLF
jgi:hypothetical protein